VGLMCCGRSSVGVSQKVEVEVVSLVESGKIKMTLEANALRVGGRWRRVLVSEARDTRLYPNFAAARELTGQ
jgi:hypothetical protein